MKTWKQRQLKQFLISTAVFFSVATMTTVAKAGDRAGNGGSGGESQIAAQQAQVESVAMKIKHFFQQNEDQLQNKFPEFETSELASTIEEARIEVVSKGELIDKHGVSRTCLNYPSSMFIECDNEKLDEVSNDPKALFVLVMHEYLGLMGVEETSPANAKMVDGYEVSKRIGAYVTKVNDYDLSIKSSCNIGVESDLSPKAAAVLTSKGYNMISLEDVKRNDYFLSHKSGVTRTFPLGLFCHQDYVDVTLLKKGLIDIEVKTVRFSECNSASHFIHSYREKEAKALSKLPVCK